jgi:effector-binding domain-containing protein
MSEQTYDVDIVNVSAVTTAVARERVQADQISQRIIPLFDRVYEFLKTASVRQAGDNIALYSNQSRGAMDLEAGVPVSASFESTGTVFCSSLPGGRAAHTVHRGPYSELKGAHEAVQRWCKDQGLRLAGPCWEIYGDWNEDPSLLQTDVYYLLG